jgi:hypothetical protein
MWTVFHSLRTFRKSTRISCYLVTLSRQEKCGLVAARGFPVHHFAANPKDGVAARLYFLADLIGARFVRLKEAGELTPLTEAVTVKLPAARLAVQVERLLGKLLEVPE